MNLRYLLLLSAFLLFILPARSAWFTSQPTKVVQPDGSVISCYATGDEYYNWLHDKDGYTILQAADGYYYYGFVDGDIVKASAWKVNETEPALVGLSKWAKISGKEYERRKQSFSPVPGKSVLTPHSGTLNNLVIFIRFSDDTEFTDNRQFFDAKFNAEPGPSLQSYYNEVSYNQLLIDATYYPACLMNSNLSYQDSHPRSYFQPYNAATNPTGYLDENDRTLREQALLRDAINWVNMYSPVPQNLTIDSDSDGNVDNISFIIRGSNTGWSSLLWSHSWILFSYEVFINGKKVGHYTFQPETQADVGTICHEMFHSLGAPDLYHYVNTSLQPVQSWDLMDQGFGHMGAYMKWKYSNHTWIDSIPLITASGTYSLNPLASSAGNCYKVASPYTNSEFYVIEYRQQGGMYESNLPGTGLLVYRINPVYFGNSSGPPDEVYIYRPGGTIALNGDPSLACFSAQEGRTSLNDTTDPSGFLESGLPGGLMISNVSAAGSGISFHITISNTKAPTGFAAAAVGTSQIELAWMKDTQDDNVLLAYSLEPFMSNPKMGVTYQAGDSLPGGGTVLYNGSLSSYLHTGLTPSTQYNYRIWSIGEGQVYSPGVDTTSFTNCLPTGFPFTESFNALSIPNCWSLESSNADFSHWDIFPTYHAGGSPNELGFYDYYGQSGYSRVILTPFNTTGITRLNLTFRFLFNSLSSGATVKIQSSTDKINWTDEEWSENSVFNPQGIPEFISTSVSHNLDTPLTYISIAVEGSMFACGTLYIDDINLTIAECDFYIVQATASPAEGGSVSGGGYYYPGQQATLSASPGNNWNFLYWKQNGQIVSYLQDYSFVVENNAQVEAVFSSQQVSILLGTSPASSGLTSGSGIYDKFQQVNLDAFPLDGFEFTNWTEKNQVVASTPSYSFSAIRSMNLVANFMTRQLNISLSPSPQVAGSCSGMGTFAYGTSDTIQAFPADGYQFTGWYENGTLVSALSRYSFIVYEDRELIAKFFCPACNVNLIADPPEAGILSGGGVYPGGSQATVKADANEGWTFLQWKEAGNVISGESQFSFTVDQNRDLVAAFLQVRSVNAEVSPAHSGTVIGGGNFVDGELCTLIALADSGYRFRYWSENSDSITSSNVFEFTVEGDRSLLALFQAADGQVEVFQQSCIVYPNPTKGTVVIDFAAIAFEHPETIEIINSLGEKLTNYRIAPGSSEVSLSTASFPSGTYFVLLLNNQKCLLVRKILVFK